MATLDDLNMRVRFRITGKEISLETRKCASRIQGTEALESVRTDAVRVLEAGREEMMLIAIVVAGGAVMA